jgi:hypothetical protein
VIRSEREKEGPTTCCGGHLPERDGLGKGLLYA